MNSRSHIFGYIEIGVKPGSVLISLTTRELSSFNNHVPVNFVQRQNISVTAPATMFTPTASSITYDPVLACNTNTAMIMTWDTGAASRDASTTTQNLVAVAEVGTAMGSTPTDPSEVD